MNLAYIWQQMGRNEEAEAKARSALSTLRRVVGDSHRATIHAIEVLGVALAARDHFGEAADLLREVYEHRRRTLGEDNSQTLQSLAAPGPTPAARG